MKDCEKIVHGKKLVGIVIRNKILIKNTVRFFTPPKNPLQVGIHDYHKTRETKIHTNSLIKPQNLTSKSKYIYIVRGSIIVELIKKSEAVLTKINLGAGDSIIIMDILHKVIFNPGSRAIEIKQGPYDKAA